MALMTSADVLKINNAEEVIGLVDDVAREIPEIDFFQASPVTKNTFYSLALDGLPTTAFRAPDALRTFQTATLVNRQVTCKYLDASWTLPVAIASQSDWGADFAKALEARAHLKSALVTLAKQIWHGVSADANGFVGLDAILAANVDANSVPIMDIEANTPASGSTISDAENVYAVRTGIDSCQIAWGNDGRLDVGDVVEQMLYVQTTSSGTTTTSGAWHYAQKIGAWAGLQVTSKWAAGRITNLSATSGLNGLDDDLLYELIELFPVGAKPDAIFLSRRSLAQLRKSRTAYNTIGAPAPLPTEFEGIPLIVSDAVA